MSPSTPANRRAFHVDLPDPARIAHPIEHIWGWAFVDRRPFLLEATVGGVAVPCGLIDRGGPGRVGFSIYLDLSRLPDLMAARPDHLTVEVKIAEDRVISLPFAVDAAAYALAEVVGQNRGRKAAFLAGR